MNFMMILKEVFHLLLTAELYRTVERRRKERGERRGGRERESGDRRGERGGDRENKGGGREGLKRVGTTSVKTEVKPDRPPAEEREGGRGRREREGEERERGRLRGEEGGESEIERGEGRGREGGEEGDSLID